MPRRTSSFQNELQFLPNGDGGPSGFRRDTRVKGKVGGDRSGLGEDEKEHDGKTERDGGWGQRKSRTERCGCSSVHSISIC